MNFYKNGNYIVCIMNDGTKIRKTQYDDFVPSFSENTDICITKNCKMGCPWCFEGCTSEGQHGNLFKYDFINTLHPYTEVALNGNDMNHPDLEKFLIFLNNKKVFANITVHQKQFLNNYELIKKYADNKLIYGIGISYSHYDENFITKVKEFPNAVIHTINGILSESDINHLKDNNLKILILGYKNLRRGKNYLHNNKLEIEKNQKYLYDNLKLLLDNKSFKLISFDNLAIKQLNVNRLLLKDKWDEFYMGDDGKFTFYIDMVDGKFAKNSLSLERYDIGNKSIDEMFNFIRNLK